MNTEESRHDDTSDTLTTINDVKSIQSIQQAKENEEPYTIFPTSRLIQFLIITALTGMISPLTGSIYFPATNQMEIVTIESVFVFKQ